MASQTKTVGCSGCLIEAIERHEEGRLRNLLWAANVEYSDTYWVPRDSLLMFKEPFLNTANEYFACSCPRFPVLSNFFLLTASEHCTHRIVEETLVPGQPVNIAMSVVLSSMLYTSVNFNAFQIVVESHKFDLNESLIFHLRESRTNWSLVIVDPAGLAMLLDNGTKVDDPNSFLLLKTLKLSSLEKDLRAIAIKLEDGFQKETADRANGALSFLSTRSASFIVPHSSTHPLWLLALLNALCRMGLCFKPHVGPYSSRELDPDLFTAYKYYTWERTSLLQFLIDIFDIRSDDFSGIEYYVACWIRCGWIGVEIDPLDNDDLLTDTIQHLLLYPNLEANFRVARQLFALGIFPEGGTHSFDEDAKNFLDDFDEDEEEEKEEAHKCYVARVIPLEIEFFRTPHSLLQLSRAKMRRLLGMNDFELRVKTLPLPPQLLEYVWRANEELVDVAPPEGLDLEDQPL